MSTFCTPGTRRYFHFAILRSFRMTLWRRRDVTGMSWQWWDSGLTDVSLILLQIFLFVWITRSVLKWSLVLVPIFDLLRFPIYHLKLVLCFYKRYYLEFQLWLSSSCSSPVIINYTAPCCQLCLFTCVILCTFWHYQSYHRHLWLLWTLSFRWPVHFTIVKLISFPCR